MDYTFYNVGIDNSIVKPSICGNISAAVGPFAIDENFVKAKDPLTTVRIYSTHAKRVIYAEVPTFNQRANIYGDFRDEGVPGSGAKIMLDWRNVCGIETGALLPTGRVRDEIYVDGIGRIEISIVDCGNPTVFLRADRIGLEGTEMPERVDSNPGLVLKLELIRGTAGEMVKLVKDRYKSRLENPNHPLLAFVSPPGSYMTYVGSKVEAERVDLISRMMFMQVMHKTYAGSGAICTGIAALIKGTVVNEVMENYDQGYRNIRIGHPAGVMEVEAGVEKINDNYVVKRAAIARTARRIMDGFVYIK